MGEEMEQSTNVRARIDRVIVHVRLGALRVGETPRGNGELPDHVVALAAVRAPLPPIVVHRPSMRVIDGRHRLRAAQLRGMETIGVRFFDGTEDDAFILAVESNNAHGLPLSMADRRNAAQRIIATHPCWSDRMIGSSAGVASATVAELRRRMPASGGAGRLGRDGRVRPVNRAEGRRRAGELLAANPGLSLRQVARQAGISPETVRDVRNRLRRGDDPVKPRACSRPKETRTALGRRGGPGRGGTGPGLKPAGAGRPPTRGGATRSVERLRADPALRFTDTGRTLLRQLNIHSINAEQWEAIIASVPAHRRHLVAELAGECADSWTRFADRIESLDRTEPLGAEPVESA
jgi:ParB-like chromosome segregation protein Spo0J